jgi:hypothetical protein
VEDTQSAYEYRAAALGWSHRPITAAEVVDLMREWITSRLTILAMLLILYVFWCGVGLNIHWIVGWIS